MDFKKFTDDLDARLGRFLSTVPATPLEQLEKQINTSIPRPRRKGKASFRGQLIDLAESLHARGAPGISVNDIIRLLGVPSRFVNEKAICTKLRRLQKYLQARGIWSELVNARYFEPHDAVRSIETARRLLPIGHKAVGLHFIREQSDWLLLASLQASCLLSLQWTEKYLLICNAASASGFFAPADADASRELIQCKERLEYINQCIAARIEADAAGEL